MKLARRLVGTVEIGEPDFDTPPVNIRDAAKGALAEDYTHYGAGLSHKPHRIGRVALP